MKQDELKQIILQIVDEHRFLPVDLTIDTAFNIKLYVDKKEGYVSIDDCMHLSRLLRPHIEEIIEDFSLDVSSPGIDQPFKIHEQYEKNKNKTVKVQLNDGSIIKGILKNVGQESIVIEEQKTRKQGKKKIKEIVDSEIAFSDIKTTKLILKF